MVVVVCIASFGTMKPGDQADIPDGSEVSEDYFAEPGSDAAMRATAEAAAGMAAPVADASGKPAAKPGKGGA